MKACVVIAALAAMLPAFSLPAEVRPEPGPGDPHIQSVLYDADQVVLLQVGHGYQLSVEFAPDERIENVAVGDSGSWQVTPNKRGDHLFIKPTPDAGPTNLTVVTDARTYAFTLLPLPGLGPDAAYTVRFRYAAPAVAAVVPGATVMQSFYKLSGAKALRPASVTDDGLRTTIAWYPKQTLPAVYTIDAHGNDVLVNSSMRDGRTVIDDVFGGLQFRFGKLIATATRVVVQGKR